MDDSLNSYYVLILRLVLVKILKNSFWINMKNGFPSKTLFIVLAYLGSNIELRI